MGTIWITGGKGFIRRHLARVISLKGNRICGIGHGLWPAEEAKNGVILVGVTVKLRRRI